MIIGVKCPNCGNVLPETLEHLESHWTEAFACDPGCGIHMAVDRGEAISLINTFAAEETLIIPMYRVD